jgi:hypothetical protein
MSEFIPQNQLGSTLRMESLKKFKDGQRSALDNHREKINQSTVGIEQINEEAQQNE